MKTSNIYAIQIMGRVDHYTKGTAAHTGEILRVWAGLTKEQVEAYKTLYGKVTKNTLRELADKYREAAGYSFNECHVVQINEFNGAIIGAI